MAEPTLIVFADYACPYCYLAEVAVSRLRQEGVAVRAAAFELRPPGTRLPSPQEPGAALEWTRSIEPLAAEFGTTLRQPPLVTRTRKAHEAVAYARTQGRQEALHEALYRAWWEEGRDIGRIDVLVQIGESVGLERGALRVALDIDQWTEQVEREQAWARQLGVEAVPAYLLQRRGEEAPARADALRIGLQRYEQLKEWVGHDV